MKKILTLMIVFVSLISAQNIDTNSSYVKNIEKEIFTIWGTPTNFNGKAKMQVIIDVSNGKLATFFIFKRSRNSEFIKYFNDFIFKLKKHQFKKYNVENPLVELNISLKATGEKKDLTRYSLLNQTKEDLYKKELKFLLERKKISKADIKKSLDSKGHNFIKDLLYAIYYKFKLDNEKEADKLFERIVNFYPDKLKESHEGIILADWLIQKGKYDTILSLFPERSCLSLEKEDKRKCYYYRGVSEYKKGLDYKIDIGIAKNYFKQAEEIYKKGERK